MIKVRSDLAWNDYLEFFNKHQKDRLVYKVKDEKLYFTAECEISN